MLTKILPLAIEANEGASYFNTGPGKAVGAILLVAGIVVAVVIFRKVIKARAKRLADKAKGRLR